MTAKLKNSLFSYTPCQVKPDHSFETEGIYFLCFDLDFEPEYEFFFGTERLS